jgi:threonine dehydratase
MNRRGDSASISADSPLTLRHIHAAAAVLKGVAHRTPVLKSLTVDQLVGADVFLKAEMFQRGGAFKFRGAHNKLASLSQDELAGGVCAWSSGNHAQAVALAARILNSEATILMPEDAPPVKRAATVGYGATVVSYDRYSEDRETLARRLAEDRGLVPIPAYDDWTVMAGQGTTALEFIEEVRALDALVVPMSGGGLMAGCATAARNLLPEIELIGAEPEAGDDTRRSLSVGKRVRIPVPRTIADGQQVDMPGRLTFEVNRRQVADIVLVTDKALISTMRLLFERLKVVAEPSGASALAAVLTEPQRFAGRRVGVILSGGNVGADRFAGLMASDSEDRWN